MRLIDIVFRPIKTSKLIMRILRDSEIQIEFKPKPSSMALEKMSEFVVLGHYYMMPASSLKLIEDTIVKVDSSGYGENKVWRRNKSQELTVEKVPFAHAVAMCVNEKLEAANGN